MATSKYEELLNMAYRATNGAGAAFSKDEQGNTYVTPYTGAGRTARQQTTPQASSPLPEETHSSKYDELLRMAYQATGGAGAAFSRDDEGNVYVTPWQARQKRQQEQQAATPAQSPEDLTIAQRAIDRILGDRTQITGEKTDWRKLLKGIWYKGADQFSTGVANTLDFLAGDFAEELHVLGVESLNQAIEALNYIPGVDIGYVENRGNFLSRWAEALRRGKQQNLEYFGANANSSRAAQIVDKFGTSTVAAIPMALEALILGPAAAAQGAGAEMTTAGLQYTSALAQSSGLSAISQMGMQGMKNLMQNPQFWTSYLQVMGDGYQDALEQGLSDSDAALYGMVNGFFNAVIEIGGVDESLGGINRLPAQLREALESGNMNVVVSIAKSMFGEGWEEVQQGVLERGLLQAAQGDSVGDMFSLDPSDTRAAFNPFSAADEFTGGAVVGGLLGGGQTAIESGLNRAAARGAQQQAAQNTQQQETVPTAQETGTQYVQQVINNMDVPEAAQRVLMDGLEIGSADPQTYAQGIQEAFRLGEIGLSYEQAVENSTQSDKLTREQFQHAWQIGAQKAGNSTETPTVSRRGVSTPEYDSIESFSREYPTPEKVTAIFDQAADTDVNEFAAGFRAAYDMGQSGVSANYLTEAAVPTLTAEQARAAYHLGQTDAEAKALDRDTATVQKQKSGTLSRVKGSVKGEGVTMAQLRAAFNDRQNTAYRLLTRYAETTGVNIVLYNSQADSNGQFPASQGRFQWKDDTIYIDINSGLSSAGDVNELGNYTMLRTFAHEFTHFIEKWNAAEYNEFRQFVFETLEAKGENVHDLIESMQARDTSGNMSYEQASREVVADALMDILPDSTLVQQLAQEHQTVFRKLLQKMREFAARMKQYYREIKTKAPREAQALKENNAYMDGIVQMWDRIAKGAVANYQGANGEAILDQPAKPDNLPKQVTSKKEKARSSAPSETVSAATETTEASKTEAPKQVEQTPQKAAETQEAPAEPETPTARETPAQEPQAVSEAAEAAPAQEDSPEGARLRDMLRMNNAVTVNGFRYSVQLSPGSGNYFGRIERIRESRGAYPVANARDTVYASSGFTERSEAVGDLVRVAENNKLLKEAPKEQEQPRNGSADAFGKGDIFNEKHVKEAAKNPAAREIIEKMPKAEETAKPAQKQPKSRFPLQKWKNGTPSQKAAYRILTEHLRAGKGLPSTALYAICDEAFGGTQAEGRYNRKDAYDAMELAVNQYITETMRDYNEGTVENAKRGVELAQRILSLLPTQNVRTQEQLDYQQFSTPPSIAYLAAWAANINNQDHVLEPSAGIGGLASFAKAWGAEVTVNELSERRYGILQSMEFDHAFNENAEHINDVLPDSIKPTVVIMNPPFSSTAGRTKSNKTSNAELHINSALDRLPDGGRLVAIVGRGMADEKYSKYWDKVRQEYTVRANIGIDGKNYTKYGTSFDVQIVVIDKVGPQGNIKTITGNYADLSQVPEALEAIRNDRSTETERISPVESNPEPAALPAEEQPVSPAMAETNSTDSGRIESGDRADAGGSRESGNADVQRTERGAEAVRDAGTRERGAVEQRRPAEKKPGSRKAAEQSEGLRPDAGTDRAVANVQRQSEQQRRGPESEPARGGQVEEETVSDDGVYATYNTPPLTTTGSMRHPAVLVESAAMAAVDMPKATYTPHLPENVVKNNLSDAQMVSVTYAGQAHEQKLPNGERRGFFIGDGTGVGKGRQISGIILDNFEQGRKKAIWISEKQSLFNDAQRDWTDTTGRSKDEVKSLAKVKVDNSIDYTDGIVFTTYDTLRGGSKTKSRVQQLADWFGKDYDGVIAFDEAHNMGNLLGKAGKFGKAKGSAKAIAAVELQRLLPNARVVYVSATAATEVDGLAFASRLGLWGKGTAFSDVKDFVSKIGSAGLSAMELVVRDMKAMGMYVARSISYNGVEYGTIQHDLDPVQTQIYNTMSRAWQKTMRSVEQSLADTGAQHNAQAKQLAIGQYFSAIQRFYNQVLTSMSMPSVIADMKKQLADGKSCVLQIVNTNQAEADRQMANIKAEGGELDDMDLTPRGTLIDYLMKCYPVTKFEEYEDEDGNLRSRPVTNSKGEPVVDKKAVAKRDALIAEISEMSIPDGPLEMLFDAFGTENVAEITGRTRRVVPRKQADGSIKRVEESRTANSKEADVTAFQNGDKRILVFNNAGGTGKSYHADNRAKNKQQRVHYVLQPGWEASRAVQGFGRTHRSNEASAPVYKLVTTNIKGQKRFTSTIARRLDQLGALTKGQRDTGSGMFGASDNLETDLARDSLREFYNRLGKNKLEGIDGREVLQKLGLLEKFTGEYGEFKMNDAVARDISKFLNRILALEVDEQNQVFDAFISIYETEMDAAIAAGTLDRGMENVKADKIEIVDDKVIQEQKGTGAATHYVQAKVYTKPKLITTVSEAEGIRGGFQGIYRTKDGAVRAVYRIADKTTEWGAVTKQYKMQSPNRSKSSVWQERTLEGNAELLPKSEWQKAWDEEISKQPEYNEDIKHMLTGSLLPIWDALPEEGNTKVQRLITDDGKAYLGRIINAEQIDNVLRRFDVNRTKETFTGKSLMQKAKASNAVFNLTYQRAKIHRSRVSGEWRLEYEQPFNSFTVKQQYPDMMMERINYQNRFFIPMNEKGEALLDKLLEANPVSNVVERGEEYSTRRETISDRDVLRMAAEEIDIDTLSPGEQDALRIFNERLNRLQDAQEQRAELGRQYKEQQFTKGGSRAEADRIRAAMNVLDSKIKSLENGLLSLENKDVLKNVLQKARRVVEQEERRRGDENLKRYRERRNESEATRKYRERVRGEVETLRKWLVSPSNKDIRKHVPAEIQKTVADFLESINLMSKTALRTSGLDTTKADEKYLKNMKKMRDAIKANVDSRGLYSGYADLPSDFIENFEALIRKTEEYVSENSGVFVVNQMSAKDLQELSRTLKTLRKFITTMNEFHNNAVFRHTYEAGEETIDHLTPFEKSKKSGTVYKFLRFDYMRPSYAFEHFGKGGKSIEHEFREGQATQAKLANKIIDFAKKTYTAKEVKTWSETVKSFTLSGGEKISLPVTHIMSLYCLNKRAQALTHIYGDGIRVANYTEKGKVQLDEGHLVSLDDVQQMISTLTPRQREVADALQRYMSTECATWGNYVSMARFDVEQFGEDNYFPINSDGRYLPATADESPDNSGLYALLNMGFTKELKENASNRIILYNIFDVFANHTASMTQYRSFALPVLDALKWFNYKNDITSVRTKLSSAFGAPVDERAGSGSKGYAESFVLNLIRAYNGTAAQGDPYDTTMLKMLHRFNGAQIAYNLRVVIQQPTAITRAAMILSPAKLSKGLGMSIAQMRKLAAEMEEHSGIAAWKALGFYDTNISRGLTELIKQNPSVLDNVMEVGTKGAEAADRFTWAAMWYAAKDTVKRGDYRTQEEYMKAVTELFEEVIYKTQVVDSLLTKSEFLRSKGGLARQLGSFMSEPSATMSMLADAHFKYTDDLQRGMSRSEAWQRNGKNIVKTAAVYAVGQAILSAMQAVMDAWRDDDEYDRENWLNNYLQKYINALKGNFVEEMLPFGKIPIMSELYEVVKGWLDYAGVFEKIGLDLYGNDISSGLSMYLKYIDKAMKIIIDKVTGQKTNYTNYGVVYNLIRGVANLSGIPFGTAWRELEDIWNNTVGFFVPNMKLKTYERAADRKKREGYTAFVQQTGLSQNVYEAIYTEADADGDGIEQAEIGPVLLRMLESGELTQEQAEAIWNVQGWKTDFPKWASKNGGGSAVRTETAAPAAAEAPRQSFIPAATAENRTLFTPTEVPTGVSDYEGFRAAAPLYGSERKQAAYSVWETQLSGSMSLDRFTEILVNADTDGNDSLKQDELGYALRAAINSGEMSYGQASAVWNTQGWKHNFDYWSGRH